MSLADEINKSRNPDNLEQAKQIFKEGAGRDLNEQELSWLTAGRGDLRQVNHQDAVRAYVGGLNQFSQRILSDAQNVYGIENFSLEDANKLRDRLYIAGDKQSYDTFWDRAGAALQNVKTDRLVNPQIPTDKTGQYAEIVRSLYQENLGRDPKAYELEHFSKQLAGGDDPFLLAMTLQQSPEFQEIKTTKENERVKTESAAAREALNVELLKGEDEAFKRALPTIMSSFQKAGRIGSSGVENALARSRQELERERQGFLANAAYQDSIRAQGYNREDFVNRGAQAFNQYLRQSEPRYQANAYAMQQQYQNPFQLGQGLNARRQELANYDRQMNDYQRFADQARQQQGRADLYGLAGNVLGAGLQAYTMRRAYAPKV